MDKNASVAPLQYLFCNSLILCISSSSSHRFVELRANKRSYGRTKGLPNKGYTKQTKGLSNKKTDLRASRRNKYRRDTIDAFSSEVISYLICILLSFSIFSALKIFILHTMHPCNTPYQSEKIPKIDFSTNA